MIRPRNMFCIAVRDIVPCSGQASTYPDPFPLLLITCILIQLWHRPPLSTTSYRSIVVSTIAQLTLLAFLGGPIHGTLFNLMIHPIVLPIRRYRTMRSSAFGREE